MLREAKTLQSRYIAPIPLTPTHEIGFNNISAHNGTTVIEMVVDNSISTVINKHEIQEEREQNKLVNEGQISNLPSKLPFFTGREKELGILEEGFLAKIPTPNDSIVRLIYGLGGIGKTELTCAFARAHQDNFSLIWFINSASPEKQHQSYRELAEELKIPILDKEDPKRIEKKIYSHLKQHASQHVKPWILIYENVEEELTPPQGGYVLITSRIKDVWKNHEERIELLEFSKDDSEKILSDITKQKSTSIPKLARLLEHFPLAVYQVARFIAEAENCRIEDYLTELEKNPIDGEMEPSKRYEFTLKNVWQMTLKMLEEKNPKASAWLKVCAHLNPDDISDEWLTDWLAKQPNPGNWDKININKALTNFSLIRSNGEGTHAMHRLMQMVICKTRGGEEKFKEAFELVKRFELVKSWPENLQDWKQVEKWVAQAIAIENSPFFQNIDEEMQAALFTDIGCKLRDLGRYQKAFEHLQKAMKSREKVLHSNHSDLAASYNNFGLILRDLGRCPEALEPLQKALKIWEKTYPNSDLIMIYDNIGLVLSDLNLHDEALEYQQNALKIMEKLFPNSSRLAQRYNNIGTCLRRRGQHQEALGLLQQALNICKQKFSHGNSCFATSYNCVGMALSDVGRDKEALEHFQEALKMREEVLLSDHPDIALSHHNVGCALKTLGRSQEALTHKKKALKIMALGEKHPDEEKWLVDFIDILSQQSDAQIIEEAKQEILPLYTEKLGENHPLIRNLQNVCQEGGFA